MKKISKPQKSAPTKIIKRYYSKDDQEKISHMGIKIIDVICQANISHAVMALEMAREYLECKIDEIK